MPAHALTPMGHSVHNADISKVRPVGHAKFSKTTLDAAYGREINIQFSGMPIERSLKTLDIYGIVLCDQTAHFRMAFYCPQQKVHLCNDHAV